MIRILAINGSYRDDGITDQAVETLAQAHARLQKSVQKQAQALTAKLL